MTKAYKISYKTYDNNRLKKVDFHGNHIYPLYVQVSYGRKTIFFKSYYFELYSKPKFMVSGPGEASPKPSIKDIIAKENRVIAFIIEKYGETFSLDSFKMHYTFYSRDLCDAIEPLFNDYLYTFFESKRMPELAVTLKMGLTSRVPYQVMVDLEIALKQPLYRELLENSFTSTPPYLPLYEFTTSRDQPDTQTAPKIFTAMDWENADTQTEFLHFLSAHYKKVTAEKVIRTVEKWLKQLKEEIYA